MPSIKKRQKMLFVGSFLWAAALVISAVQPEGWILFVLRTSKLFSLAHLVAYGILAFLLCLYLRFRRTLFSFRMNDVFVMVLSFLVTFLCGGLAELLQVFSRDRIPDWMDLQWDLAGAVLGIVSFLFYTRVFRGRKAVPALEVEVPAEPVKTTS